MLGKPDVESGDVYGSEELAGHERELLLPSGSGAPKDVVTGEAKESRTRRFTALHLVVAFLAGLLACFLGQLAIFGTSCFSKVSRTEVSLAESNNLLAPPYAGSTERHQYPPTSPANAYPSLFPTSVGYAGGTPTGAEPAVIATAPRYPVHTGAAQLVVPTNLSKDPAEKGSDKFDMLKKWGNLSPWYSVGRETFGLDSGPEPPETCRVTGLHLLHRHGARYPTDYTGYGVPAGLASRLNERAKHWEAEGDLEFLNEWTYKLGEEILTPFGRQQLFDLGLSTRLKYGYLLKNFTDTNTIPVFRTESQDRMLHSALNFAIGFFGYPFEGQYQQSITIEAENFNNTLAPYKTCPNSRDPAKGDRGQYYVEQWSNKYLKDAVERLQRQMKGYNFTIEDMAAMQHMCAYETVALGYSKFCELFTEEEWDGFDYALDLKFWYGHTFGSPLARSLGVGWVQELVARLTHSPISVHNSSTNATLDDNPITFPLSQSLYVDATHEVVVLNVITALNLTSFAEGGPLPIDHIPENRTFRVSEVAPFATNVHFQILECTSVPGPQIRIVINDGVVPLTGVKGCPKQEDGMCPVDTFVAAQKETIAKTDWAWSCHGDWKVPEGPKWNTTTGEPPRPDAVI